MDTSQLFIPAQREMQQKLEAFCESVDRKYEYIVPYIDMYRFCRSIQVTCKTKHITLTEQSDFLLTYTRDKKDAGGTVNLYFFYLSYKAFLYCAQFEPVEPNTAIFSWLRSLLAIFVSRYKLERWVDLHSCTNCFYDACVLVVSRMRQEISNMLVELLRKEVRRRNSKTIDRMRTRFDIFLYEYLLDEKKHRGGLKINKNGQTWIIRDHVITATYLYTLNELNILKENGVEIKSKLCPEGHLFYLLELGMDNQ